MRNPIRHLRHSCWSPFLVPLALPLFLLVPGTRSPAPEAQGVQAVQEISVDQTETPASEDPSIQFQSSQAPSGLQHTEATEGRRI